MHQIEFDVKERRDGSIEVRYTWTHDVGLPTHHRDCDTDLFDR